MTPLAAAALQGLATILVVQATIALIATFEKESHE